MKKQTIKILIISLLALSSSIKAESINEIALIESIKATCSVNKEVYEKCFGMRESDCKDLLTKILPQCSKNKNVFPFDKSTSNLFIECVSEKFEKELSSKGLNLDKPCSK